MARLLIDYSPGSGAVYIPGLDVNPVPVKETMTTANMKLAGNNHPLWPLFTKSSDDTQFAVNPAKVIAILDDYHGPQA